LLAARAVLAVSGIVFAQDKQNKKEEITSNLLERPTTSLTPLEGNTLFLACHGVGTQGYVCLPKAGASWSTALAPKALSLQVSWGVRTNPQALVPYSADYFFFRGELSTSFPGC
jgi:hypothetical protein